LRRDTFFQTSRDGIHSDRLPSVDHPLNGAEAVEFRFCSFDLRGVARCDRGRSLCQQLIGRRGQSIPECDELIVVLDQISCHSCLPAE